MLRLNGITKKMNIPLDINGFFEELKSFMEDLGYPGAFHNIDHSDDVERRFHRDLLYLKNKYPGEFDDREFLMASMASMSHDCIHNAYGQRQPPIVMTANSICELYGLDLNDSHMRLRIIEAINIGIDQDNQSTNSERKKVTDPDATIAMSEEEMSQIVQDAFAYKNGFAFEFRCDISGMVQATESKRSMSEGKPGFKWPRTQMELLMKLADIGNFSEPIDVWLSACDKAITELPFFAGTSALEFVNEELVFINTYVKPALDVENHPTFTDLDGKEIPVRVPDYYYTSIDEKERYLFRLKAEIEATFLLEATGDKPQESQELKQFKEAIRGALGKTDKRLLDPKNPVPLVAGEPAIEQTPTYQSQGRVLKNILGQ